MFDIDGIIRMLEPPTLYQASESAFWDDRHISKQMLKAHLDPDFDGASRKLDFIERFVSWIRKAVPPESHRSLLDVGCGPGLYAERFARGGYAVTGVDFSRRSIRYAESSARKEGLQIDYRCQDYLALEIDGQFDLATMIYCDYGALSTENRRIALRNIYRHLAPGGELLLDAFSMAKHGRYQERQTWEAHRQGGFWREEGYVELKRSCRYSDDVTFEQYVIATARETTSYYLWNTYFTRESLAEEAKEAGFGICGIFGDVAGSPFDGESPTIAVLLIK